MIKTEMNLICDSFIAIMAFRYALGRCSTAPSRCADWLTLNLPKLSNTTLRNIEEEIDDAQRIDDDQRERDDPTARLGVFNGMLGMDCDRSVWFRLREAVQAERAARERRPSTDDAP